MSVADFMSRALRCRLLELLAQPCFVVDVGPRSDEPVVSFANHALLAMIGRDPGRSCGRSLAELLDPGCRTAARDAVARAVASGDRVRLELTLRGDAEGRGREFTLLREQGEAEDPGWRVLAISSIPERPSDAAKALRELISLRQTMAEEPADPQHVRQAFAEAVRAATEADEVLLEECSGQDLTTTARSGPPRSEPVADRPLRGTLQELSLRANRPLLLASARSSSHLLPFPVESFGGGVVLPLCLGGRSFGALTLHAVDHPEPATEGLGVLAWMLSSWLSCQKSLENRNRSRQLLLDSLPVLVSYVDREQRYQDNNAAYARWFGVDVDSIRGRHLRDVLGRAAYERIRPRVEAALAGDSVSFEETVPYRDAGTRRVVADYVPDRAEDGTVLGFFALVTDIEDRVQAETDFLTGTLSRRKLVEELDLHLAAAHRYDRPLAIALVDFDRFKQINDRFGHPAGDEVLRIGARVIGESVRAADLLGRWGGEEFLLIAPESDLAAARAVAERVRAAIEAHDFSIGETVTASTGIAAYRAGETNDSLLRRADEALYRAKTEGRNRVEVAF